MMGFTCVEELTEEIANVHQRDHWAFLIQHVLVPLLAPVKSTYWELCCLWHQELNPHNYIFVSMDSTWNLFILISFQDVIL